jgi:hypothetical protein
METAMRIVLLKSLAAAVVCVATFVNSAPTVADDATPGSVSPQMAPGGNTLAQPEGREGRPGVRIGDRWRFEHRDPRTGIKEAEYEQTIIAVSEARIEGTEGGNRVLWTPEMNEIDTPRYRFGGARFLSFPLEVGKRWTFSTDYDNRMRQSKGSASFDVIVVGYEKVTVPAGSFDAFKIEAKGNYRNEYVSGWVRRTYWFAPSARNIVKIDSEDNGRNRWTSQLTDVRLVP